jgi:hypothetical protein
LKIVCFYGDNPLASWMLSRGLPAVLRRMGHEVIEIPTLGGSRITRADAERINKPISPDTDLIIVSGPEYLMSWIKTFYPQWKELRVPKACWYHESETRDDRIGDFSQIVPWFDFNFMPNAQDAERYNCDHLPVGVDTHMFRDTEDDWSGPYKPERTIDCAFIGTLYDKREQFLRGLLPHLGRTKITVGQALVKDIEGINLVKSVELLASEYRRVKILVNLPTLSHVLVSKVLEAAASGCLVLTPEPKYADVGVGYEPKPEALGEAIKLYADNPRATKEQVAKDRAEIHTNHRMELRLEKILAKVGAGYCESYPAAIGPSHLREAVVG